MDKVNIRSAEKMAIHLLPSVVAALYVYAKRIGLRDGLGLIFF